MDEKDVFVDDLKSRNDPVDKWSIGKLKKEAEDDSGKGQSIDRDDIGID